MGIRDWVSSACDKVKQNAPDLTAVIGAEKMKEYMPGSEGREKIEQFATEVVVPVILGYTGIPGARQIWRIIFENLSDGKKYEPMPKELEKLKNRYEELKEVVEIIKHENKILSERFRRFQSKL